ncbi:hypothetical protein B0H17DRAFT_1292384 [Mycena rosella]|uniref:Uncharacterized protein n=1 Tax=Mycena rosella TaxID=1033263 RepID=A0AAD7GV83_MYCRO|nr:hypothetical protein B0H17DRAFT_1292384 [Mycena rosella]
MTGWQKGSHPALSLYTTKRYQDPSSSDKSAVPERPDSWPDTGRRTTTRLFSCCRERSERLSCDRARRRWMVIIIKLNRKRHITFGQASPGSWDFDKGRTTKPGEGEPTVCGRRTKPSLQEPPLRSPTERASNDHRLYMSFRVPDCGLDFPACPALPVSAMACEVLALRVGGEPSRITAWTRSSPHHAVAVQDDRFYFEAAV